MCLMSNAIFGLEGRCSECKAMRLALSTHRYLHRFAGVVSAHENAWLTALSQLQVRFPNPLFPFSPLLYFRLEDLGWMNEYVIRYSRPL